MVGGKQVRRRYGVIFVSLMACEKRKVMIEGILMEKDVTKGCYSNEASSVA